MCKEDYDLCCEHLESFLGRLSGSPEDITMLRRILRGLGFSDLMPLLPYEEYLRTQHWNEIRSREVLFAGHRCRLCNAGDCELHVHHRTYERLGRERPDDVLCLCGSCHATFHDKTPPPTDD